MMRVNSASPKLDMLADALKKVVPGIELHLYGQSLKQSQRFNGQAKWKAYAEFLPETVTFVMDVMIDLTEAVNAPLPQWAGHAPHLMWEEAKASIRLEQFNSAQGAEAIVRDLKVRMEFGLAARIIKDPNPEFSAVYEGAFAHSDSKETDV